MVATWNTEPSERTINDSPLDVGDTLTYEGAEWRVTQVRAWNETLMLNREGATSQVIDWSEV